MRLTELEPRWIADYDAPPDAKQGVSFLCPCCKTTRIGAWFDTPVCGNPDADPVKFQHTRAMGEESALNHPEWDTHLGRVLWHRTGDTFETLSLSPSIDCSKWGHWHGYVTNGEIK